MKIKITLIGTGGELNSHTMRIHEADANADAAISYAVSKLVLHTWTLAAGDTIKITEEE